MKKKNIIGMSIGAVIGALISLWLFYPGDLFGPSMESALLRLFCACIFTGTTAIGYAVSEEEF